jgi:4'-phosphopantetheinyl transferase EntD
MMRAILPDSVMVVEGPTRLADARLLPQEAAALGRVSATRLAEFTASRTYARQALAGMGLPLMPILSGPQRQPLWPSGIVGSITHCADYCAVAVARETAFCAIGIDAEPDEPLPNEVLKYVALGPERDFVSDPRHAAVHWDRLLFSAKESIFKAWFQATGQWLDFMHACVTIDCASRQFHARIYPTASITRNDLKSELTGRYMIGDGRMLTALVIEKAAPRLMLGDQANLK